MGWFHIPMDSCFHNQIKDADSIPTQMHHNQHWWDPEIDTEGARCGAVCHSQGGSIILSEWKKPSIFMHTVLWLQPRDTWYEHYGLISKICIKKESNHKVLYLWVPHEGHPNPFMLAEKKIKALLLVLAQRPVTFGKSILEHELKIIKTHHMVMPINHAMNHKSPFD